MNKIQLESIKYQMHDLIRRKENGGTLNARNYRAIKSFIRSAVMHDSFGVIMPLLKKHFPRTWEESLKIYKEPLEYTLPDYYAAYLINGDSTSLEESEITEITTFVEGQRVYFTEVKNDSGFRTSNILNSLGCNCSTYIAYQITFCYETFKWIW